MQQTVRVNLWPRLSRTRGAAVGLSGIAIVAVLCATLGGDMPHAVPALLLLVPRLQAWRAGRWIALALIVAGVVAYRWDTNLVGQLVILTYLPSEIVARYTSYVPSLVEIVSGAGIVAYGLLAFTLGVKFLNVVEHPATGKPEEHTAPHGAEVAVAA